MFYVRLLLSVIAIYQRCLLPKMGEAGFDTFMETTDGFEACVEEDRFEQSIVIEIINRHQQSDITHHVDKIEKKNWNEEWEKKL